MSEEHRRESSEDTGTLQLPRPSIRRPRRYAVLLHNDDYTTMEFVVAVLTRFFARSETEATRIMLEVHHKGRGVAGIYLRDVAESKVEQVEECARSEGHPLKCTTEPVDDADDMGRPSRPGPESHGEP